MLGRRLEPQGVGFAALIAPAYWVGGPEAVEIFLAAIAAFAFVLGARLARRIVPEPWASGAALIVGLSPPALAQATTVYPELVAGAMLTGAVLAALRVRERPDLGSAVAGAGLLALLPWLGPKYLLPAAVVAVPLVRWTARRGRRTAALAAGEIMVASLVVYATVDDRLYGGLTPSSVAASGAPPTGASSLADYVSRTPRLAALWIDRDVGLLRWAPILLLAVFSAWLLWRSRRLGVARAVPERADAEAAAGLSLAVCAAVVLVAVFAAPTLGGDWFPARHLVAAFPVAVGLVAWGLRHAPRTGAVLAALTLAGLGLAGGRVRVRRGRRLGPPGRRRALRAAGPRAAARRGRVGVVRDRGGGARGRGGGRGGAGVVARAAAAGRALSYRAASAC